MSAERLLVDFVKCGAGQGARCCAYLLGGLDGAECGRITELAPLLRNRAENGEMVAQRLPVEPYPDCQLPEDHP